MTVIDHLDGIVDALIYRPNAVTAYQMRQAADEIQRCWKEHEEDLKRMERAAEALETVTAERDRLGYTAAQCDKACQEYREALALATDWAREAARLRKALEDIERTYHPDGNPLFLHEIAEAALTIKELPRFYSVAG